MKNPLGFMKQKNIKKRRKVYAFFLSLTILVALVLIITILSTNKSIVLAQGGIMLSPIKDGSHLIFTLTIYIAWHIILMGVLFRKGIENFFLKHLLHKQ